MSPIEMLADRAPVADGVKVTPIEHFAPAATLVPQLVLAAKSLAFVPVIVMPVMLTATLPLLLRVMNLVRLFVPTA